MRLTFLFRFNQAEPFIYDRKHLSFCKDFVFCTSLSSVKRLNVVRMKFGYCFQQAVPVYRSFWFWSDLELLSNINQESKLLLELRQSLLLPVSTGKYIGYLVQYCRKRQTISLPCMFKYCWNRCEIQLKEETVVFGYVYFCCHSPIH